MIELYDASGRFRRMECSEQLIAVHGGYNSGIRADRAAISDFHCDVMAAADLVPGVY
jgi:hypothetical protein